MSLALSDPLPGAGVSGASRPALQPSGAPEDAAATAPRLLA